MVYSCNKLYVQYLVSYLLSSPLLSYKFLSQRWPSDGLAIELTGAYVIKVSIINIYFYTNWKYAGSIPDGVTGIFD
jgi:hypothetical protein